LKILHFSDTHLGFSDLDIVNSDGVNMREADFYRAFSDIIDSVIELKPNYVIHTGDLFHRASPTNRAIAFALKEIGRLNSANIPLIMIAGNHEAPKTKALSPILKIFDTFENVYVAYEQKGEIFKFKDIDFFCLPHINSPEQSIQELERFEQNIDLDKNRVLLMHCSVGRYYLMQEFGEWVYPKDKEYLFGMFDYVALGHWHSFGAVGKFNNVYYAGSSERTSSSDRRNHKGYVTVDLNGDLKVKHHPIKLRTSLQFKIDAKSFEREVKTLDMSNIDNALVEVILTNLDPILSVEIDNSYIKSLFKGACSVKVKREFIDNHKTKFDNIESITLQDYFLEHLDSEVKDKEQKERLLQRAKELFSIVEEESSDDTK